MSGFYARHHSISQFRDSGAYLLSVVAFATLKGGATNVSSPESERLDWPINVMGRDLNPQSHDNP